MEDRYLDYPYEIAGRLIDPLAGTLSWQGQVTHLRRKELEVLAIMASATGAIVSRQAFVSAVWNGNELVGDRGVSDTIFSLRRSLRDNDPKLPLIRTIPRRGYQLSVPVQTNATQRTTLLPGSEVLHSSGWRLMRKLGESVRSESWLAEPSEYNAEVESTARQVFQFCRSEAYLRHLQREVTLLRYVNQCLSEHPGFAVIRDWQLDEPPYYLRRDYARFGCLREWTQTSGTPQTPPLALMVDVAEALAALHQLGVVHRGLNADRILVDETQAGPKFKISALGTSALTDRSKLASLHITALGLTLGAEELEPQASTADDIAALGLVFLQLSVGDWNAGPDEAALGRVTDARLQGLLRRCLGSRSGRPTASALLQQLRSLLAPGASTNAHEMPAAPQVGRANLLATAPVSALSAPEFIGRYRLLDCLGEGGMGVVYLAEQRDPYRKVALKIIRSGMDGTQILNRFAAEHQALAMMNHPNVASVLDSGLATDGRPFFAMEYIAGKDIKSYCDDHQLSIKARIKLFLQVCDGVLHAHQKGVLHRDIKPGNLMVTTAANPAGIVKVIDFGLAKSLHGRLTAQTLHTSFGAFVGTPIYSSPEHVSGSAGGVDTRSDIYSMGVVLYELLVGMTPIAAASLENLEPEKVREIVCKSRLPSMREQLVKTSAQELIHLAAQRAVKVDELPKTLDGDLSWVVGKCLERDPNDRYAPVQALANDLQRWLELRPVEARPTSGWYRFRKLVRRNRASALLIAGAAAVLLFTTTAAVVGYLRAERALEASRLAESEASKAADFQVQRMQSVDPAAMGLSLRERLILAVRKRGAERGWEPAEVAKGEQELNRLIEGVNFTDLSLEQLDTHQFQPTLASITKDFKDQPVLQARLWQSLADSLAKLGRIDAAMEPQQLALEQRQRVLGDHDPLTLISLRSRGELRIRTGQFEEAEVDFRSATLAMQRVLGDRHLETLRSQHRLAEALHK
jgi:serine/threonine protein kinase